MVRCSAVAGDDTRRTAGTVGCMDRGYRRAAPIDIALAAHEHRPALGGALSDENSVVHLRSRWQRDADVDLWRCLRAIVAHG